MTVKEKNMFDDILKKPVLPKEVLDELKNIILGYMYEILDELTRITLDMIVDRYLNIANMAPFKLDTIIEGKHIKVIIVFKKYNNQKVTFCI